MISCNELDDLYSHQDTPPERIHEACLNVDLNDRNYRGRTPLHLACTHTDETAVRILLGRGADVQAKDREGNTPLWRLADLPSDSYNEESIGRIAEALIGNGAKVPRSGRCSTALIRAIQNRHFCMVKAILDSGAGLDSTDNNGENALHALCKVAAKDEKNAYETAKRFLGSGQFDPEEKSKDGKTALDFAMEYGAGRVGTLLAGNDADDELQALAGGMDIFYALHYNNMDAVDALLRMGTDLQTVCEHEKDISYTWAGKSPLACALISMKTEAAEMLLMAGADPNFVFSDEYTAFSSWVKATNFTIDETKATSLLKQMLRCGWQTEASADREGNTALSFACRYAGHELGYASVRFLLENGADVNASNNQGQTPAMNLYGAKFWDGYIPKLPQQPRSYPYGNRINQDCIADLFELLLEKGAHLSATDKWGNTLLHYIASSAFGIQAKAATELISDYGTPDAGAANNEGKTAVDIASECRNETVLKYLLRNS